MEKTPQRTPVPTRVAVFELPPHTITIVKLFDFRWVVISENAVNPLAFKVVDCISFEHAWGILEACAAKLKVWKN